MPSKNSNHDSTLATPNDVATGSASARMPIRMSTIGQTREVEGDRGMSAGRVHCLDSCPTPVALRFLPLTGNGITCMAEFALRIIGSSGPRQRSRLLQPKFEHSSLDEICLLSPSAGSGSRGAETAAGRSTDGCPSSSTGNCADD
jgi:hypothetical protein